MHSLIDNEKSDSYRLISRCISLRDVLELALKSPGGSFKLSDFIRLKTSLVSSVSYCRNNVIFPNLNELTVENANISELREIVVKLKRIENEKHQISKSFCRHISCLVDILIVMQFLNVDQKEDCNRIINRCKSVSELINSINSSRENISHRYGELLLMRNALVKAASLCRLHTSDPAFFALVCGMYATYSGINEARMSCDFNATAPEANSIKVMEVDSNVVIQLANKIEVIAPFIRSDVEFVKEKCDFLIDASIMLRTVVTQSLLLSNELLAKSNSLFSIKHHLQDVLSFCKSYYDEREVLTSIEERLIKCAQSIDVSKMRSAAVPIEIANKAALVGTAMRSLKLCIVDKIEISADDLIQCFILLREACFIFDV